jgi:hypothetical protein
MLNPAAFANSLAILTGALYILFYLISPVAPESFRHLFNVQFLGADVASLFPKEIPFSQDSSVGVTPQFGVRSCTM